jgi:hypothetical protein
VNGSNSLAYLFQATMCEENFSPLKSIFVSATYVLSPWEGLIEVHNAVNYKFEENCFGLGCKNVQRL